MRFRWFLLVASARALLLMKKGETELEDINELLSGFRSYLDNLALSVLENAEELRESRSTNRKQQLCGVVDFINIKEFSNFKGLRFEESSLKGSKSLKRLVEAFRGVFELRG
jgi:hypothetical protein